MDARAASFPIGASATIAELEGPDPHGLFDRLREREPVSWLPVLDGWLVTRRDVALAAMRDDETFTVDDPRFSTARVVGPSMLSLDGPQHARHRAPFAEPFRLGAVRDRFTRVVEELCSALLDSIASSGGADLRQTLSGPLSVGAMAVALGLDDLPADVPLTWYRAIVAEVTDLSAGRTPSGEGREAFRELSEALHRALGRDPGSSLLASAAPGGHALAREEVVSNAAVLLFGGIETTDGMVANALWHVLAEAGVADALRRSPELVANAVEESLRLEPAAGVIDRYATRDVELAGAEIRRGDLVRLSLSGANRDPAIFSDPHRFDVHRPNAKLHAAFAQGPHVCLGMHLARLEARIALTQVLGRLPNLQLESVDESAPQGLVFRKPPELRVRWTPPPVVP